MSEPTDLHVPSSPEDRRKLKAAIVEMTKSMLRMDTERDLLKEIAKTASEDFQIPKKIINKLARTMYKNNYNDLQAENEHFEFLYETLVNNSQKTGE